MGIVFLASFDETNIQYMNVKEGGGENGACDGQHVFWQRNWSNKLFLRSLDGVW